MFKRILYYLLSYCSKEKHKSDIHLYISVGRKGFIDKDNNNKQNKV